MDNTTIKLRTGMFVILVLIIALVGDGLPKIAPLLSMQLLLLPVTLLFCYLMFSFLHPTLGPRPPRFLLRIGDLSAHLALCYALECMFLCLFLYETRLYAPFGYRFLVLPAVAILSSAVVIVGLISLPMWRLTPVLTLLAILVAYVATYVLAIWSFPINYLRSDMLAVIFWSDRALIAGQNPYQHFHIVDRIYDFPYLPGMLLVFAPAQAVGVDLRWISICYTVLGMLIIFGAAPPRFRSMVVALIGLFLLNPYFQYRHELYTHGHFLSLIIVFVLMQHRRFVWAAIAFGLSMTISQFSWVIFPFFLMNALRRKGWIEVGRMALIAGSAGASLIKPFISSGLGNIAHNAVGQWDMLRRPIARPMNLAFWASYVVRPSHLKWLQLAFLSGMFCYCWAKNRCTDLEDTLRWMIAALTLFILLNVLLDGYFYLMLLVPMLVYTCVANGWWGSPPELEQHSLQV